jgi:alkylhydroperoxidase family enzyme
MRDAMAALRPPEPRHPFPKADPNRPKAMNLLGTFARHPSLTRAYNTFNGHVLFASTLPPRLRELVVLRVAAVRDAEYEWAQHVVLAVDEGITPDEIERVRSQPDAMEWSRLESSLLRAVDELVRDASIGDDTWTVLASELDDEQLMDFVFTVGAYDLLAMMMRSFGVQLDDDLSG